MFLDTPDPKMCLRRIAEDLQRGDTISYIELILTARVVFCHNCRVRLLLSPSRFFSFATQVPIVKFTDKNTGISVDICINVKSGREAFGLINGFLEEHPSLRPLTLFLKYFLYYRDLNETYTGGIGSFVLQMMIISHLQVSPLLLLPLVSLSPYPLCRL